VTLAASGLTVVAVDRNEHALRELPGGVRPEAADATDPAAAKSLIDRIAGEVEPPDVLVNTIGAFRRANHPDPMTTSHLPGGKPGPVAKVRPPGDVPRDSREIP
jgi:NAD(P)-dependent dehydrogenase (short-subunit alcohol dehydrogenase family)